MKRWSLVYGTLVVLLFATFGQAQELVKDRKNFIPNRKQVVLGPTAIGILLADGQPILSTEGRSGPADQLVFSSGGNSYRWVYVPTEKNPQITNLQVPVGVQGEKAIYPSLNLANLPSVIPFGITQPYVLVEVDVNTGRGSPAGDSFVGSNFRVLDGSREYPLKAADVIKQMKARYAENLTKNQKTIDKAMKDAGDKALNGKAPTGPREKNDLMYVTWMPESNTMRVHFKTTISDGAYTMVNPGGNPLRDPPPLELPPKKEAPLPPGAILLRAAPPRFFPTKVGTTFGIELGQAFIINKKGEVVGTEDLPIETFTLQLNPPPGIRPGPPRLPGPPQKDQD